MTGEGERREAEVCGTWLDKLGLRKNDYYGSKISFEAVAMKNSKISVPFK